MQKFIANLEYIIFGPLFSLKSDPESEKIDIAEGRIDTKDIPELESEEEAVKTQKGQKRERLKIMTPMQMITRLKILLSQVKAGNNSQKLKTEIRQIAYSLYRSNNLSKTVYNNLIKNV